MDPMASQKTELNHDWYITLHGRVNPFLLTSAMAEAAGMSMEYPDMKGEKLNQFVRLRFFTKSA